MIAVTTKNSRTPVNHLDDSANEDWSSFGRIREEQNRKFKSVDDLEFVKPHHNPENRDKIKSLQLGIPQIDENQIKFTNFLLGKGGQGIVTLGKYLGSKVIIIFITIMAVCFTVTQFHIVMEYFDSCSLHDILFRPEIKKEYVLNTQNKNKIAYQLCCPLSFLHLQTSPIIHRDVKPANVLVDNRFHTKLCDLGLGTCGSIGVSLQSTRISGLVGTYLFMALEIVLHRKEATEYSNVWAFGCTLIELYEEKDVWIIDCAFDAYYGLIEILRKKEVLKMQEVPLFLKSILLQCFDYDSNARPKMSNTLCILEKVCESTTKSQS